jgi:hypothetical protein
MGTSLERRAVRSAQRAGYVARKSNHQDVLENLGGFMIVDPRSNIPVAGFKYDLSAEAVIDFCTAD